ncbi:hypothetical protein [Actimicrobium antarcticum]
MALDMHHRQIVQDFIKLLAQKGRQPAEAESDRPARVVKLKTGV